LENSRLENPATGFQLPSPVNSTSPATYNSDLATISVGLTGRKGNSDVWGSTIEVPPYGVFEDESKKLSLSGVFRTIWNDSDSKHLFLFICLLFFAVFIQFFYGFVTGSLGLLSTAFHTSCDLVAMCISLAAMVFAKHQPTRRFSYGYDRMETLASFSNGVFLLFVSLFLVKEIIERFLESEIEEIHTNGIIPISLLALVINIIGVTFFRDHARIKIELRHNAHEENIYTIVVHILVDIFGNIGNIIAVWLLSAGFHSADAILAIIIISVMIYNALPIVQRTGKILFQTTPFSIRDQLEKALRESSTLDGVLECKEEHFWTQSPGVFVGTLIIRVRSDAQEQVVLQKVQNLFRPMITHLTVQVEKDNWAK